MFSSVTTVKYALAHAGFVRLKVLDVTVKEPEVLVDEEKQPGSYEVKFVADKLPAGIYFFKMKSGNLLQTGKVVLMK